MATKTKHTYLLELAKLVGEVVFLEHQQVVVGRHRGKHHHVFLHERVSVEQHTTPLDDVDRVLVVCPLHFLDGKRTVVAVINDEAPPLQVVGDDLSPAVVPLLVFHLS